MLILDDNEDDVTLVLQALKPLGYFRYETANDKAAFYRALSQTWDVIIADYNLGDFNAIEALRDLAEQGMQIPVIVCTGALARGAESTLLNLGATAFVMKGDMARLPGIVRMVTG